ncbi:hypothetical protein [Streptomyces sp. HB132]|nr:hypothetical protein [Streptomyces sp. HB132]MBM7437820.1 hypothetical protein [Streptomyces sp. HB132]
MDQACRPIRPRTHEGPGTTRLVGNPKILESSFGPEDLYLAQGRGGGVAP